MNVPNQPMTPVPPKKGLSPLAWVGIGCGVIVVLGVIALVAGGWWVKNKATQYADKFEKNPTLAAAEVAVRMNPELELVKVDDDKGTLTIRNKKTGEEITMNAEDVKEGKVTFKTKDGTTTFDASGSGENGSVKVTGPNGQVATFGGGAGAPQNLPSWLPTYPGGTVQGSFDSTSGNERTAAFSVTTTDPADKVLSFYEEKLKGAGLKVDRTNFDTNGMKGGVINGTGENPVRQVGVTVGTQDDGSTSAAVTFSEKKG